MREPWPSPPSRASTPWRSAGKIVLVGMASHLPLWRPLVAVSVFLAALSPSARLVIFSGAIEARAASTRTEIIANVTPFTHTGALRAGTRVVHKWRGMCEPGSDVLSSDVYRCFSHNLILDPCWRDFRASRPSVICLEQPWADSVVRLQLKSAPPATSGRPNLKAEPWGIRLGSGARCLAVQGAHDSYVPKHGKPVVIDYSCGSRGKLLLLRGIDRKHSVWTIRAVRYTGKLSRPYTWAGRVGIRAVWFGGNNPLARRP